MKARYYSLAQAPRLWGEGGWGGGMRSSLTCVHNTQHSTALAHVSAASVNIPQPFDLGVACCLLVA